MDSIRILLTKYKYQIYDVPFIVKYEKDRGSFYNAVLLSEWNNDGGFVMISLGKMDHLDKLGFVYPN